MHAHIASMIEELDGPGCGYALALFAKKNHKCVPMDSTFVRKIVYHRLVLLGRGTCNTKREHLEAVPAERPGANNERWKTKAKQQNARLQKLHFMLFSCNGW
jgi:hypothetical protein